VISAHDIPHISFGKTEVFGVLIDNELLFPLSPHMRLFGGLEHDFYFSIQLEIVPPTDELHHFSEG
jgi:hypothetical protein